MKKAIQIIPLLAILFITAWILNRHFNTLKVYGNYQNKKIIEAKLKKDYSQPRAEGFEKQLIEEKVGEGNELPYGMRSKWLQHETLYNTRNGQMESPFDTIFEMGPMNVGGRTRAIHIDPVNPDRIFAGGVSGGLWISEDRGSTWQPIDDFASNLTVTSITYNPFNPNVIYYSTGEPRGSGGIGEGVFKSVDGGASFEQLPSSLEISDFKYTWAIAHSLADSNTLYVASIYGLYKTIDGGASWQKTLNVGRVNDILNFEDGSIMVAIEQRGIYYSENGEEGSFSQFSLPVFPDGRIKLAYCASQKDIIYAMLANDYSSSGAPIILKSINRGQTWQVKTSPLTTSTQHNYNMMLQVHPSNPNQLVCGAVISNFSNNGGDSWFFKGVDHSDYHACVTFPDNENQMLIGNDGGVYRHFWNTPFSFNDLNRTYSVTQFYAGTYSPVNDLTVGGTQDNGTIGVKPNQSFYVFGADGGYAHLHQEDANIVYYSTQNEGLFRAVGVQGGTPLPTAISYPPMYNEGVRFINPYEMNYVDGNQLYYRTDKGLWRSDNRGNAWEKMNDSVDIGLIRRIAISTDKDPHVYFNGYDQNRYSIFRSKDGLTNESIEEVYSISGNSSIDNSSSITLDVHPDNNDRILLANYNYSDELDQIWLLNDVNDDNSIVNVTGNLPDNLPVNSIKFHPYDPEKIMLDGTDFGLYYTLDGGQNWIKENRLPNVQVFDIRIRKDDGAVFLFTYGRGIWKAEMQLNEIAYADLPYEQDFESGSFDAFTEVNRTSAYGRIKTKKVDDSFTASLDVSLSDGTSSEQAISVHLNTNGVILPKLF